MYNLLTILTNGIEDLNGLETAWNNFWSNYILAYLLWGISFIFIALAIKAGYKLATANSPEEKQAAKSSLISMAIGLAVCLLASTLVTIFKDVIAEVFSIGDLK